MHLYPVVSEILHLKGKKGQKKKKEDSQRRLFSRFIIQGWLTLSVRGSGLIKSSINKEVELMKYCTSNRKGVSGVDREIGYLDEWRRNLNELNG